MGRIICLSTEDATRAPAADPAMASGANHRAVVMDGTRRASVKADVTVPKIAATLLAPRAWALVKPGLRIITKGMRISPPPPTTASTQPAANEPTRRMARTVADIGGHLGSMVWRCGDASTVYLPEWGGETMSVMS